MDFKKILVTGAAGFIGANFVKYWKKEHPECEVIILDKLTYAGKLANVIDLINSDSIVDMSDLQNCGVIWDINNRQKVRFIKGDVCDLERVERSMGGCDAIVHFAAESHVDRSIGNSGAFVRTNVLGTHTLLEEACKQGIKKFVYISTDEVYGSIQEGSFDETDLIHPNSPYSASKAAAELIAFAYKRNFGLPVVITRCVNNFGPYQHPEKFIPRAMLSAFLNENIKVYGYGLNVRDWIYAEDHCRAIDFILQNDQIGGIVNVGAGNEKTNVEIVETILKLVPETKSKIKFVSDRLGHDFRYSVNSSVLENCGFKLKYGFEEAIKKTVDWYRNNKEWWKSAREETEKFYEKIGR